MSCEKCKDIVERPDLPHVIRKCEQCGRDLHIHEPGKHGRGFNIRKGDQVVIPKGFIKTSLNPLKSNTNFTRAGVAWYAELIHMDDFPNKREAMPAELERLGVQNETVLRGSLLLDGLSLDNADHFASINAILDDARGSREWWARLALTFLGMVRTAIDDRDPEGAAWAMACAERCRSMLVFKDHLEDVVLMGNSAQRVVSVLRTWDASQMNSDEGFWQLTFAENSYALSQVFAAPLVFIKDSAYVGGMNVDRKSAKFADFLFAHESSHEGILVEIKTPTTELLGRRKYRQTYRPSSELTGAVMQVLDYRRTLVDNQRTIMEAAGQTLRAFSPKCVVVAGNGATQLDSPTKRTAFEDYRANSRDVEVVTYDELFRKIEVLANLFGLSRAQPEGDGKRTD